MRALEALTPAQWRFGVIYDDPKVWEHKGTRLVYHSIANLAFRSGAAKRAAVDARPVAIQTGSPISWPFGSDLLTNIPVPVTRSAADLVSISLMGGTMLHVGTSLQISSGRAGVHAVVAATGRTRDGAKLGVESHSKSDKHATMDGKPVSHAARRRWQMDSRNALTSPWRFPPPMYPRQRASPSCTGRLTDWGMGCVTTRPPTQYQPQLRHANGR